MLLSREPSRGTRASAQKTQQITSIIKGKNNSFKRLFLPYGMHLLRDQDQRRIALTQVSNSLHRKLIFYS